MKVSNAILFKEFQEKKEHSANSYEKRMWSERIKRLEQGLCPYCGVVDYKKQMETDTDKYLT